MTLARVLVERANRVRIWRQRQVIDLEAPVGDRCDDDGVVRFRPAEVVDAVGSVEREKFGNGRSELEDMEAAVA